jgi:hypothetical protein
MGYLTSADGDGGGEGGGGGGGARGGGSFLNGGATPGIVESDEDGDDEDGDPRWRASVILHELDRMESSSSGAVGAGGGGGAGGGIDAAAPPCHSVPWLDALTRARCLDVLRERECDDGRARPVGGGGGGGPPPPPPPRARRPPVAMRRTSSSNCRRLRCPCCTRNRCTRWRRRRTFAGRPGP